MGKKPAIPNYGRPKQPLAKIRTRMVTEAEIQKIKDEATQKAVDILQAKNDPEELRTEGYNEAILDATKYFVLCGCKVLHDEFGFGYKRLAKFVDSVADVRVDIEEGKTALETLEEWLDVKVGMILQQVTADEIIAERKEKKNGAD